MANFKRGKCRYQSSPHISKRGTGANWLSNNPRWWDILYHNRPRRRAERALIDDVRSGRCDPDDVAWPVEHKPHNYYW